MNMRRRLLLLAAAAVLFAGMFAQITVLSLISEKSKAASVFEREISTLQREMGQMELAVNQLHNLESIAARAQELGMEQPDESQIRVINVD